MAREGRGTEREPPDEGARRGPEAPSHLSYVLAIASGALILALLAFLTLRAARDTSPAAIQARVLAGEIRAVEGSFYVPLEIENIGGATAKEIMIETEIEPAAGAGEPETAETVVDYLAGQEAQSVYAVFDQDPRGRRLTARVVSFQEP